jgi:alpha-galactosidase
VALALFLAGPACRPDRPDPTQPTPAEMARAHDWADAQFGEAALGPSAEAPFSFTYGGVRSAEFLGAWTSERASRRLDRGRTERTVTFTDPATGLVATCTAVEYGDFPTVEWTVHLRNAGPAKSPLIENLLAADLTLPGNANAEYLLHHSLGSPCQPNDFEPLETVLGPGAEKRISAAGGRPTNSDMCYFNVEGPGGGVIAAIGWPGQWATSFEHDRTKGLRIRIGQEQTRFRLDPGEEARTPLVVLQFWRGGWIRSQNIWRRWMMAHNMPRPDGKPLAARFDSCFGNLKPSAAEETAMIEGFVRERIPLDAWILDAGWYPNQDWWDTAGTWAADPARFPRGLREVADKAHAAGMKFVLWFEPERVTMNSWIAANHPEWLLPRPGGTGEGLTLGPKDSRILDLGDPRARAWLVDDLDAMFKAEGIDVFRTDFNINPLPFWRASDPPDRQGLTENHYVTGLLAYWDELERRDPARWIDTCASGGRRLDLETLRRAAPLLRSDYLEQPVAHQSHTYGLSLWLPWYGSGTGTEDLYLVRSSICPAWRLGHDMRRTGDDYDALRREVANFRAIQDHLLGDYYPLAAYSQEENVWMAFQFDRPEKAGGAVLAFRRRDCQDESRRFKLQGLDRRASYEVTDLGTGRVARLSGAALADEGVPVRIEAQPGAVWLSYRMSLR